jgi:hypothetical protein
VDDEATAVELLRELCDDMLDVQIGTLMFWGSDEKLAKDHFAEYVHYWLLKASKTMGWEHYDSSHVWEA